MLSSSFCKKLLVITSVLSAIISYHYLPQALSIFDIAITMNRNQAIEESRAIVSANHLVPQDYEHATYFSEDSTLQYFIELAAGGKKAFKELVENHVIEPYTWVVRWYKEGQTAEVTVAFTASGVPYSFSKRVPEMEEGAVLSEAHARQLAQHEAAHNWNIDFSVYKPFEYKKEERPSKRLDHIFTYQRDDISLGDEGKYRVKIVVSGDKVTTVAPFVFIPESFIRRYQEMRSENNTITIVALSFYRLFYLFGGIILLGAFLLYRRRLQYKYAAIIAAIMAVATLGTLLSQWPFLFIDYNTALSKNSVGMMYCLEFGKRVVMTFLTTFIFAVVAYGIDRWAFSKHESMWNFFSIQRSARRKMLWYVLGGYLGVFVKLAYLTGAYLFLTGSWMDWWSPAWKIVNPNVLALGVPWLDPIVHSFSAGFTEELLFRVIPLSVALVVGRYFKKEKLFLVCGLFIQALVFTALHANYTTYPAYFRIVEMFPSAIVYGVLYLLYGLIPGTIMHWMYDLLLMSLPIMVSTAPGMMLQKIIVLILGFLPLIYVVYARYRVGHQAAEIDADQLEQYHYEGEKGTPIIADNAQALVIDYTQGTSCLDKMSRSVKFGIILIMASFVGIMGYKKYQNRFTYCQIPIVSKDVVCNDATERMMKLNPDFLHSATQLCRLESHANTARPRSSFAWRTMNHDQYFSLADDYVYPMSWNVRYVRFDGSQTQRAEDYFFMYSKNGTLLMYSHSLSDQIPGTLISEIEARKRALAEIKKMYHCDDSMLKEISVESIKKPERLDWNFIFEDTSIVLIEGKAYIKVTLCGDEINYIGKYIFIPENWSRMLDQENAYKQMAFYVMYTFFYLMVLVGVVYIKPTSITLFARNIFIGTASLIFGAFLASLYFRYSLITYEFQTSVAWVNQLVSYFMPKIVLYIIVSILLALALLCYRYSATIKRHGVKIVDVVLYALFFALVTCIMETFLHTYYPLLGDTTILNSNYPSLLFVDQLWLQLVQTAVMMYLSMIALTHITHHGTRYKLLIPVGMFFIMAYTLDFSLLSTYYLVPLLLLLASVACVATVLYYSAIRYDFFSWAQGYLIFAVCNELLHAPCMFPNAILLIAIALGYYSYIHWYRK